MTPSTGPAVALRAPTPAPTRPARAAPQRGPRPAADRSLRGARGASRRWPSRATACCAWSREEPSTGEVIAAVESDVALAIAVLRLANQVEGARAAGSTRSSRPSTCCRPRPCRRSPHARARSTSSSARPSGTPRPSASACTPSPRSAPPSAWRSRPTTSSRDRLMVTALLHDVGKLVLHARLPGLPVAGPQGRAHARGAHPPRAPRARRRPRAGRRRAGPPLGPARRRSPRPSSATTPRTPTDEAAFVRLADMLAHYAQGGAVSPSELLQAARAHRPRPRASCAR